MELTVQVVSVMGKLKPVKAPKLSVPAAKPPITVAVELVAEVVAATPSSALPPLVSVAVDPSVVGAFAGAASASRVSRSSRLPASLAPLSRVVDAEMPQPPGASLQSDRRSGLPPLPMASQPLTSVHIESPTWETSVAGKDGTEASNVAAEMSTDAGFAAAVAAISMSASARRRRAPN